MTRKSQVPTERIFSQEQHSNLRRAFTLSSLAAILAILLLVGAGIYTVFNHYVITDAEKDAISISNAIISDTLQEFIRMAADEKPELVIRPADQPLLDRRIEAKLRHFGVLKIKVFDRHRTIVYSNDRQILGEVDPKNAGLTAALAGRISSKLENKAELWDLADEKKFDIDMVETYMPLLTEHGAVAGAFEVYMDVSAYRQVLVEVLSTSLLVVFLALCIVFVVQTIFMHKATRIIYSKSQQIRVLSGLLPICSACKKIRNDHNEWENLEAFITERSESEFTHSLCPDCLKHYWGQ